MIVRASVSLLVLAWASTAAAQSAPARPDGRAASKATTIDEIVVTAQRREERLVDVPLTVTAVSAEQLSQAGTQSLETLNKLVPGIYIQRNDVSIQPTIRGIGTTASGESNVAVYVDNVYEPNQNANLFDLASISNIEVLKGPQGTLFGRNATGGAILVTTLDPSFSPDVRMRASYERFGTARVGGYVNLPLTDQFAVNGDVSYRHSDGYIHDLRTDRIVNASHEFEARGKLLWKPTDDVSLVLTGYHSYVSDPTGESFTLATPAPFYTLGGLFPLPGGGFAVPFDSGPIAHDRFHLSHNVRDIVQITSDQYVAHLNWNTPIGKIQSISAYQWTALKAQNDLDGTYFTTLASVVPSLNSYDQYQTKTKAFSQEVNLTSSSENALQYVAGVYYFHRTGKVPPDFIISGVPQFRTDGRTDAIAAYVDGSYHFAGNWVLIAGARVTHEKRTSDGTYFSPGAPPVTPPTGHASETVFTPRLGVRYELTPQSNVYATFSRGYKAGLFNALSPTNTSVGPEYVNAYEVGYKTSQPNFTLSASGYYYDYSDLQANSTFTGPAGNVFFQLVNVPKAKIYGVDIDSTYRFNSNWDVRAAAAYTHARYTDYPNAPAYALSPVPFNPANPIATLGNAFLINASVDASGNHMIRAPDWSASAALNYHHPLWGEAKLDASLTGSYSSRVYFDFPNALSQPAYVLMDANATVTLNQHVSVSAYVHNLTDKTYFTLFAQSGLGNGHLYGTPRVYGVQISYKY